MKQIRAWRSRGRGLRRETYALFLACRDRRTPWLARALGAAIVAYALSPMDLIPDFIPVLGMLDDLVLLPLGLALVLRMIPREVMADSRARADLVVARSSPTVTLVIVAIWALAVVTIGYVAVKALGYDRF